ncbi:CarD family transcriptional regulator [Alphaproteobacteria bacterium]|nr:CarD family transcriptional regulator [Alphaproteobacteria bacterium]GHS99683.1 CarD family transcriptional regulator [Alphaproteobacteria bacterium]
MTKEADISFKEGDFVVYPAHGVGKIVSVGSQEICGVAVELFVIEFNKDHMVLKLPVQKAKTAGLRHISTKDEMEEALGALTVKTKRKKAMWSHRAQEYETKINSGSIGHLADVIRELHLCQVSGDQSYSERQIYQTAFERFVREMAVVENIDEDVASSKVCEKLNVA